MRTENEIHVFLIGIVECIKRVIRADSAGRVGSITRKILQAAGSLDMRQKAMKKLLSPLPSKMIIGILREPKRRITSCAMIFSRKVDLPEPVPPTMTPCFMRTMSGQSHGSLCTL